MNEEQSYNGWPTIYTVVNGKRVADWNSPLLTRISVGGYHASVSVGAPETIFQYIADRYAAEVEPISSQPYGYDYRRTTGGTSMSCHASGTALDLNAVIHPWQTDAHANMTPDQIKACRAIVADCDGVVQWLEDFDPMHWQIIGSPRDAGKLALRIANGELPAPGTKSVTLPNFPTINIGSTGEAVKAMQRWLNHWYPSYSKLKVDGIFGRATANVVKQFKANTNMYPDTEVNPWVWARMEKEGFVYSDWA